MLSSSLRTAARRVATVARAASRTSVAAQRRVSIIDLYLVRLSLSCFLFPSCTILCLCICTRPSSLFTIPTLVFVFDLPLCPKLQHMRNAVIVGTARTAIGSFNGKLAGFQAPELGTIAIKGALEKSGVAADDVQEAFMGNVVSANAGQAPTRQAVVNAGLPLSVPCTTVNKVCSSGMKTIMFGAQAIMTGYRDCIVAGGMESMSNIPYYVPKARFGLGYGHGSLVDGVLRDGLWDAFDDHHMGMCAEKCATQYDISREDQDDYALESYRRANQATADGKFKDEIVPVEIKGRKGIEIFDSDEEPARVKVDKVRTLRPAFTKDGTVTAANASSLNDGACAHIVTSEEFAKERGLKPIARILGFSDAAQQPIDFTTAPALAIPMALKNAGIEAKDVDFWEINEAFSVVSIANNKLLELDPARVSTYGGAVAMGHPIGVSGARIVTTLLTVMQQNGGRIGVAGICNGGGGASAMVVELLE
jgi:acetyl-CoA C-acetyltransferase